MSAFICSDLHFQLIGQYAEHVMGANAATVADTLKRENIRSVNCRYKERTRFSKVRFVGATPITNAADIATLCTCLDYQSCETSDWRQTVACSILTMVQQHANNVATALGLTRTIEWAV